LAGFWHGKKKTAIIEQMDQGEIKESRALPLAPLGIAFLIGILVLLIFSDGLDYMVAAWDREEYNHGYLIPVVALYLLWLRAERFGQAKLSGSWMGPVFVLVALAAFVIGELSSIFQIVEYGFLLALFGVIIAAVGWPGFRIVWVPFVYLVFMIPLPQFMYQTLSGELQLISSQLGVAVIRFFGVSVYLSGNVIDLGVYKLQVAEACSGLRYLFPLMSFGFLCAAIYIGPWWHRAIIFLSGIPLTIFMNSFRIGVIGILVHFFGIEQAEGFLHYFEGWIVFMACVGILFLEMALLAKLSGKPLMSVFGLDIPPTDALKNLLPQKVQPQILASVAVLSVGVLVAFSLESRQELIPERESFSSFPLTVNEWIGRDDRIDDLTLKALATDDYFLAEYRNQESRERVSIWIAYYNEQRKGRSVHSPRACLPGGGWQLESFAEHVLPGVGPNGEDYVVNRSVVAQGDARQLVYYWFVERGRIQANEYLVRWYIFWDALTKNRTDGALVRVTTYVTDISELDQADQRLERFVRAIDPKLAYYLPQESATFSESQAAL
jgi:exosortase D (VPLPA-CTERM-specific)